MKKTSIFITLFVVLALLTACTSTATEAVEEEVEEVEEEVVEESTDGEAALTVGEKSYTQSDLEALGTMDVDYTNKDDETSTYTGVLIADILEDAGVSDGENATFVASDGYEAEVTVAEIMDCTNCIIAFDDDSLRTVLPDFASSVNVKGVVEISVD